MHSNPGNKAQQPSTTATKPLPYNYVWLKILEQQIADLESIRFQVSIDMSFFIKIYI